MKKLTFLALTLLTAAVGTVKAQYPPPRRYPNQGGYVRHQPQRQQADDFYHVKFGIVGGANISNLVNVNNPNYATDSKIGWNAGVSLDLPVAKPLAIELEALYSEKGYKANTIDGDFTQRLNFIDVPILAKLRLVPGFNFVVGPQISFLTSAQNVYRDGFTVTRENVYNNDANGYTKSLLGGVVGVGIDLSPNVELRGRYTLDLQNNDSNGAYAPQYRNQVFQVGLGFKFF